jgi:O-antigen/teichoic acid export membrane protein
MPAKRIHNITALGSGFLIRTSAQTILGLVIARLLHVDDFAVVRIIAAYWLIMAMFGRLSMLSALISFGSATDVPEEQKAYGATATGIALAASLVVIVVVQCIVQFTNFLLPAVESALTIITFGLPFACLAEVYMGSMQARGKFVMAGRAAILYGVVPLIVIALTTWRFELEGWIAGKLLAELLIFAVLLYFCRDWVNLKFWCTDKMRQLLGFAKINFFSGVFSVGYATVDILILSQLTDNLAQLGCYGLAIMIFRAAGFAPQAVAKVFVREIALGSARKQPLAKTIRLSLLNCLVVGLAVAAGFVIVMPYLITALLSSEYAESGRFMVWLAPGFVVYALYICCQETFIALRKPSFALAVHSGGLALLITMLLVAVPAYGALGVIGAISIGYLAMVLFSLYLLLPWLNESGDAELVRT